MNKRIRGLILPIPLLLAGQAAQALGLGELKVESALDQPLKGQIRLILNAGESLDKLQVKMAAAEEYERVGLDPTLVPPTIKLAVRQGPQGPYIEISSSQPVNEPIVSLLLEADWPKGRLLREYTLLLDPPSYAPVATVKPAQLSEPESFDAVVQEQPSAEPAPVPAQTQTPPEPVVAEEPEPAPEPVQSSREFPVEHTSSPLAETVEVQAGNTLWSIASENRLPSTSVQQMMVAILRANPDAFLDGNMNKLKKGSLLRIPSAEEVADISRQEALAEVASHSQQWVDYQEKAREVVPSAYQTETASPPPATTADSGNDYQLDLVPPAAESGSDQENSQATGTGSNNPSYAELALAREDVATLEQEKKELASRIQELESIVNDQQAVLQMKDADLAKLQEQLASLNEKRQALETSMQQAEENLSTIAQEAGSPTEETASELAGTAAEDAEMATEEAKVAEATEPQMSEGVEVAMDEAAETETAAEEAHDVWDQTDALSTAGEASDAVEETNQPVTEEPVLVTDDNQPAGDDQTASTAEDATSDSTDNELSWWQKALNWMKSNPLYAGGAALLLLLLGLLPRILGKEKEEGADIASSGSSFLDSIGKRDEDEAEPEINIDELLERIEENPDDVDLLYQAALHYYGEDNKDRFESMAEELYGRLADPNHPKWQEIAELGQKIAPENALFGLGSLADDPEAFEEPFATGDTQASDDDEAGSGDNSDIDELSDDQATADDVAEEGGDLTEENEFSFDPDVFMAASEQPDEEATEADSATEDSLEAAATLAADLTEELDEAEGLDLTDEVPTGETVDESGLLQEADLDSDIEIDLENDLEIDFESDLEKELDGLEVNDDEDQAAEEPVVDLTEELQLDDEEDLMDFDFGEEASSDQPEQPESGAQEPSVEDETVDLGFNLDDIVPEGDAVATKLDLARAYYEMGDIEGARIMLDEVEEEGNAEQQAEARKLRDEMDGS